MLLLGIVAGCTQSHTDAGPEVKTSAPTTALDPTPTTSSLETTVTTTAPAPRDAVSKKIQIEAETHRIPGTFMVPPSGGSDAAFPALLMLHGFGADKDEGGDMFRRLAEQLADVGYASLRIDFAGTGDSEQPWMQNDFDGMVADATAALSWLSNQSSVDDDRIGVHGWSLGGRVAATVAGSDSRVRTLSTWAGGIQDGTDGMDVFFDRPFKDCAGDAALESLHQCAAANGSVLFSPFGSTAFELSQAWFETIMASQALSLVAGFEGPQLAVHGERDLVFSPDVSREVIARSGSRDATLRVIPDSDHAFGVYRREGPGAIADEVLMITAAWIESKL